MKMRDFWFLILVSGNPSLGKMERGEMGDPKKNPLENSQTDQQNKFADYGLT